MGNVMVALTEGAIAFDTAWITQVIEIVKTSMGLLTEFPCNLFLAGGLLALGLTLFKRTKKVAQ